MELKEPFLWGSATAAYQCEGGYREDDKGESIWDVFCHSEKNNINAVTGDVASDHYHRYEEDIRMLKEGGQNAYRFSLAWTRIIPKGTGKISQAGIAFYKRVLAACKKYGVTPLVTIYHYDLPQPLMEIGGWENREVAEAFADYAQVCFEAFGDEVRHWVTINEPDYDTMCAYAVGNYPPNVTDMNRRAKALYHMLLASAKAVSRFRKLQAKGMIGLVHAPYPIATLQDDLAYREAAKNADLFYNRCIADPTITGWFCDDLFVKLKESNIDLSFIKEGDKQCFMEGTVDFLGLNVYERAVVKPYTSGETCLKINNTGKSKDKTSIIVKGWFELDKDSEVKRNPWGMEVYPKCIYDLLYMMKERYGDIPFIITENGIGYYDKLENGQVHDPYRIEYLDGFIDWMWKAKEEGIDVRGYFVWSTMDLYSWINGYEKRYGLVYVDYEDHEKRYLKDSYYWYQKKIDEKEGKEL